MSRLLLDTSAYSALLRGDERAKEELGAAEEVYLTPVVVGELLAGFGGGRRRAENEKTLREFLAEPRVRVAVLDEETSVRYAAVVCGLRDRGTPIPANDVWIAASAMQHGLEVLTADAHYARVPQIVVRDLSRGRSP